MTTTLIQVIAATVQAFHNCADDPAKADWRQRHHDRIEELVKDLLPSGSGIDSGTVIDLDHSTSDRVVLALSYHHMNDGGMYDGWTDHTIIVTPAFRSVNLRVTGRNRNDIKDYLYDIYQHDLTRPITFDRDADRYTWADDQAVTA